MRRAAGTLIVVMIGMLGASESASACSCAVSEEPLTLKGRDAAATARLIDIETTDPSNGRADFTYRVTRVWKGGNRFNLVEHEEIVIHSYRSGATCGLPSRKRERYGLLLYKTRNGLTANLCTVVGTKELRRAAQRSGNARRTSGPGCAGSAT